MSKPKILTRQKVLYMCYKNFKAALFNIFVSTLDQITLFKVKFVTLTQKNPKISGFT